MATGPEHYRKAEELLDRAASGLGETHASRDALVARAHVHATLAAAAATALADRDLSNWIHVAWKSGSIT